jgi:hypothetical protein
MKTSDWTGGGTESLQRIEKTFWHSGAQTLSSTRSSFWWLWFKLKFSEFQAQAQRHKDVKFYSHKRFARGRESPYSLH